MVIYKIFTFDSAHSLPNVPEGHKCKNVHGHTYQLSVFIENEIDDHLGWIMDFGDLKKIIQPLIDKIDHKYLNDISGLENPTCEIFVKWIWDKLLVDLPMLKKLELSETPTSGAIYEG